MRQYSGVYMLIYSRIGYLKKRKLPNPGIMLDMNPHRLSLNLKFNYNDVLRVMILSPV